jgi:hypothetical protein
MLSMPRIARRRYQTARNHAEQSLHRHGAHAERFLPLGLRRVMTVEVKLGVVHEIDCVLAIVLLRDVDAGAMADAHALVQVLEAEAEAFAVAVFADADVSVETHGGSPGFWGFRLRELRARRPGAPP